MARTAHGASHSTATARGQLRAQAAQPANAPDGCCFAADAAILLDGTRARRIGCAGSRAPRCQLPQSRLLHRPRGAPDEQRPARHGADDDEGHRGVVGSAS